MNEFSSATPMSSSHEDIPAPQGETAEPEGGRERLIERTVRYVKELGNFVRLFFSLLLDERVDGKVKIFVASVLAYVFAPLDFIPELFTGLFGMLDDFVLSAFALNVILNWVDPEIVKSHWKGNTDLLSTIQKAFKNSEILVPETILKKIEMWISRHASKAVVPVPVPPADLEPSPEEQEVEEPTPKRRRSTRKKSE